MRPLAASTPTPTPEASRPPRIRPARVWPGFFVLLFVVSGCGLRGGEPVPPSPQGPGSTDEAGVTLAGDPSEDDAGARADSTALAEAEALLRQDALDFLDEGNLAGAAESWEAFLAFRGMQPGAEEALWWLAVLHILPDSPIHSPQVGEQRLAALAERFPGTMEGQQARLILLLMTELEETRRTAEDQAERLDELARTIEALRRIDLNRRPGGGPP